MSDQKTKEKGNFGQQMASIFAIDKKPEVKSCSETEVVSFFVI